MNLNELEERMKGHAKTTKSIISTPFNLKNELNKLEEKDMKKFKNITWLKRVSTIAATLTICAITVVSAGALNGYFKDVKNFSGAIVGIEYLNATNEIKFDVLEANDEHITLNVNFTNPNEAPFASKFTQELAVTEYKILDKNDNEILTVNSDIEDAITTAIDGEEILIKLPIADTSLNINDTYTLKISTIYGLSKADQPLKITGDWKYEFKR